MSMKISRRTGEKIIINNDIVVKVFGVNGSQIKLGIDAPNSLKINRKEFLEKFKNIKFKN